MNIRGRGEFLVIRLDAEFDGLFYTELEYILEFGDREHKNEL